MEVNYEEMKIIKNITENKSEEFKFTIQNYKDNLVNSVNFFYQIEILGADENINVKLFNCNNNEYVNLNDYKTAYYELGLEKKEIKYVVYLDLQNSLIKKSKKIGIKINTKFK